MYLCLKDPDSVSPAKLYSDLSRQIKRRAIKQKCKEKEYNVQEDDDVAHKYVKMFCNANQFPSLPFFGPHIKPNGVRGLSKHYHM